MEMRGSGGAVISITGNRCAVVDYDEERVILRTGRLTVCISGRGLRLASLTENSAVIQGTIAAVEYTY